MEKLYRETSENNATHIVLEYGTNKCCGVIPIEPISEERIRKIILDAIIYDDMDIKDVDTKAAAKSIASLFNSPVKT